MLGVPEQLIETFGAFAVDKFGNDIAEHIVYDKFYFAVLRNSVPDSRRRIEWIG